MNKNFRDIEVNYEIHENVCHENLELYGIICLFLIYDCHSNGKNLSPILARSNDISLC